MYDPFKLPELIELNWIKAGSTVIDVYPGDGDWTRLSSQLVGAQGRVYSFVPIEIALIEEDQVSRTQTLAGSRAERTPRPRRRTS